MSKRYSPSDADAERQLLTSREREILRLIVAGKSNRQMAAELKLSVNTVRAHRANIMAAVGIHKSTQLVVYAMRTGLVVPSGAPGLGFTTPWEQNLCEKDGSQPTEDKDCLHDATMLPRL